MLQSTSCTATAIPTVTQLQSRPIFSILHYWNGDKDPTDPYYEGDHDQACDKQKDHPYIKSRKNHFENFHIKISVSLWPNEIVFVVEPGSDEPSQLCSYKG